MIREKRLRVGLRGRLGRGITGGKEDWNHVEWGRLVKSNYKRSGGAVEKRKDERCRYEERSAEQEIGRGENGATWIKEIPIQEAKHVESWPNTTSAWAGWSRFDIPVDRYAGVHPANLHQHYTGVSYLPPV